jgi:hypothetical protein
MEEAMNACTPASVFQLFAAALTFLLAVLWLETHWVRIAEDLHNGDIAGALRKRGWLNALVALGAVGATILLLFWAGACANGAF